MLAGAALVETAQMLTGPEQRKAEQVRRIVAGDDADEETTRRRLEATAHLLQVAGTPRGQHLSQQTPRDVLNAEAALQQFIRAHGGGAEGLEALQQLMANGAAASAASHTQPPPPQPMRAPPRDPPVTLAAPTPSVTKTSVKTSSESSGHSKKDKSDKRGPSPPKAVSPVERGPSPAPHRPGKTKK